MNQTTPTSPELASIQELGQTISRLVSGGNYVASFVCDQLPGAPDLDAAIAAINEKHRKSQLQKDDIQPAEGWSAAWQGISECIWYGVDANDGNEPNRPPLTQEGIGELGQYRDRMKELLNKLVDEKATIYTFGWSERIKDYINLDDYVVMWAYRFIILNPNGSAYLLHGSSSD